MRNRSVLFVGLVVLLVVFGACKSKSSSNAKNGSKTSGQAANALPDNSTIISTTKVGSNVMTVTVNGSLCGDPQYQYINEPCTSVTICAHGTANCQTINNILVDTGSSGLRLFQSVVTVPTEPVMVGANKLGECISYTGNSSEWGQVVYVDVQLAGEAAVKVPIELINSKFAVPPASCSPPQVTLDTDPQTQGFNGILGVGVWNQDCGSTCTDGANNGMYYACSATSCVGTKAAVQVQNPVALLAKDNNGVVLQLPSIVDGGALSITGSLILGIGTESNNVAGSGVTMLATDEDGLIATVFAASSNKQWPSYFDSGTPTLFVPPAASIISCGSTSALAPGFFCPVAVQTATAVNFNATGKVSSKVSFQVNNAETLLTTTNMVFNDIAIVLVADSENGSNGSFCWGLPFFMGRSVFSGIEKTKSSLGVGPYYAY